MCLTWILIVCTKEYKEGGQCAQKWGQMLVFVISGFIKNFSTNSYSCMSLYKRWPLINFHTFSKKLWNRRYKESLVECATMCIKVRSYYCWYINLQIWFHRNWSYYNTNLAISSLYAWYIFSLVISTKSLALDVNSDCSPLKSLLLLQISSISLKNSDRLW